MLKRTHAAIALSFITAVGFAVRIYRLGDQSLWWDDYNGLAHLSLHGFFNTMAASRNMNPEGAPLYHILQYAMSLLVGSGEYVQRLINVAIASLTIPLVYTVAALDFTPAAALVAAVLFALSPTQIFHAQSLRIYPLEMFLSTLSVFSLIKIIQDTQNSRRWFWTNLICNGLLCITHIFGIFAVAAEGAALLFRGRVYFGQSFRWARHQVLFLLPCALWIVTMPPIAPETLWHFQLPQWARIFQDFFGDDIFEGYTGGNPWALHFRRFSTDDPHVRQVMNMLQMLFFVAVIAGSAWSYIRNRDLKTRRSISALWAFWCLPLLILLVLAALWRPYVHPRYTMYSCIALYALTGAFIDGLPGVPAKAVAFTFLLGTYFYQLLFLLPVDTRTEWRQAARLVASETKPGDVVLTGGLPLSEITYRTFCYHLPPSFQLPVVEVKSFRDALSQIKCFFAQPSKSNDATIWYVLDTHWMRANGYAFKDVLEGNHIAFQLTKLEAMEHIFVYHITQWASANRPLIQDAEDPFDAMGYNQVIARLGFTKPDFVFRPELSIVWDPGYYLEDAEDLLFNIAIGLADHNYFEAADYCADNGAALTDEERLKLKWYIAVSKGEFSHAEALATKLTEAGEDETHFMLALALLLSGDSKNADGLYRQQRTIEWPCTGPWKPAWDAVFAGNKRDAVDQTMRIRNSLFPHGHYYEKLLYRTVGLDSWLSVCGTNGFAPPH